MNVFQRRVAWRVLAIHLGVIGFFAFITMTKGCFRPKDKPEIVTFIEFGSPAPAVEIEQRESLPDPEPSKPEPPAQEPEKIPEQAKETIKLPPKVVPPKKVVKPTPLKKKWKPASLDDIKIGKKVGPVTPPKPALTPKEIKNALNNVQSSSSIATKPTTGPVGNPSAIAAYDALIYSTIYSRWTRDNLASGTRAAKVTISISSSGRVLSRRLKQSSGDAQIDTSVMAAVKSVTMMPKAPPRGYELNNIVVSFTVTN